MFSRRRGLLLAAVVVVIVVGLSVLMGSRGSVEIIGDLSAAEVEQITSMVTKKARANLSSGGSWSSLPQRWLARWRMRVRSIERRNGVFVAVVTATNNDWKTNGLATLWPVFLETSGWSVKGGMSLNGSLTVPAKPWSNRRRGSTSSKGQER
jgi:hypothetical protein